MSKKLLSSIIIISVLCVLGVFVFQNLGKHTEEVKAGSAHNVFGFAWAGVPQASGEKLGLGWISFNCNSPELPTPRCSQTNYGVNIEPDGNISGYAYFDMDDPNTPEHEVGWIDFDPSGPYPNCPPTTCPDGSPDYSAYVDISGKVTGWARALNQDGGWDGWILLGPIVKGGTDYGVYIDPATGQFHGWAWGDDVMGWISFNCENRGVCSSSTGEGGPSNYKVYTTFSFNSPPTVTNLKVTPYYCDYSPNAAIILTWDYSDPEGTPQSAFQIQIATDPNFADADIVYNHTESTGSNTHWLLPAIGAGGPLSYGQTYYWRVKVWDQDNQESEWSSPNCPYVITLNQDETTKATTCFKTASHAWPEVSFSFKPHPPTVDEVVEFYGEATPYGGASITNWYWTFAPDGNPYHASTQNTQVTFPTDGDKNVTLEATDSDNYSCKKEETINVKLPLPGIIEIPPK